MDRPGSGAYGPFRVTPLGGALGAAVEGVDLAGELPEETIGAIRQAWLDHVVLFFEDQPLEPAEFLRFARRLGDPVEYPFVKGLEDTPEVIAVTKLPHETVNFGGVWHTDSIYLARPPMATLLVARQVPPSGGDTLWANLYAAYEALPGETKGRLEGLTGVNTSALADVSRTREARIQDAGRDASEAPAALVAEHPVVRTHPETGRKALYVSPAHTARFGGWSEAESRPLLQRLFEHALQPRFTCRFRWQAGSLALWDNRCALHFPMNDYHGHTRIMHRISLAGDVPR